MSRTLEPHRGYHKKQKKIELKYGNQLFCTLEPYRGYGRIQGGYGRIQKKTGLKFVNQFFRTMELHQGYDREKNKIEWKYVNQLFCTPFSHTVI
jgi:hypothetical protein